MKNRILLACVVVLALLSVVAGLLNSRGGLIPERTDGAALDQAPVAHEEVLARAEPRESKEDLQGPGGDERPRWIQDFPDIDLDGRTTESVLMEFWGPEWPAVREHVLLNMGGRRPEMQEGVLSLLAANGPYDPSNVGDLDAFLKALPEVLIGNYDREKIRGVHGVATRAAVLGSPFGMSFVADEVLQPAVAKKMSGPDPTKVPSPAAIEEKTEQIMLRHGPAIQSALDELLELAVVLGQEVRAGLVTDLDGLSPQVQPRVGNLFVSPLLSTKPMARPGSSPCSGATCLMLHSGGSSQLVPGYWAATYEVDINDFHTCVSTLAAIAERRKYLAEWLFAVIASEVGK